MTSKHDYQFDDLVLDRTVWSMLGVTSMTLWRWTHDADYRDLDFPPPIKLGRKSYRSRTALNAWTQQRAVKSVTGRKRKAARS